MEGDVILLSTGDGLAATQLELQAGIRCHPAPQPREHLRAHLNKRIDVGLSDKRIKLLGRDSELQIALRGIGAVDSEGCFNSADKRRTLRGVQRTLHLERA